MDDDERYRRGRQRFLEVHDEKALAVGRGPRRSRADDRRPSSTARATRARRSRTRDREIAAVAALVALGRSSQIPQHLRASLKAGVTPDELTEVIIQTATIAGFPVAMNAMSTLRSVLAERDRDAAG